jgi:hypothetical protein
MGPIAKKESQYSVIAAAAYKLIIQDRLKPEEAWQKSAKENAGSSSTQNKGCPKQTFLGLCYAGDLAAIQKSIQIDSINYQYAKYAIGQWRSNPALSIAEMWRKVNMQFPNGAQNHNGQLHVVKGVWNYLVA